MRPLRLLPFVVLLAACGQTGPLVLPEQSMAPPASEPVVVTTPQDSSEDDVDAGDAPDTPSVASPSTP